MPASKAKKLKDALRAPKVDEPVDYALGLSSGCTMLNLTCTGRTDVAWLPGHFYPLVGGSSSGKTWVVYQTMAEAARNHVYDRYKLRIDAPERGALMNVPRYFGRALHERLEVIDPPSASHEQFYDRLDGYIDERVPFVEGVDSEDALMPEAFLRKVGEDADKRTAAAEKEELAKLAGSYGMERAKVNSDRLRKAHNGIYRTGSILFMIKQVRDKIGFGAQPGQKTKSGGNSITHYATNEVWFKHAGDLYRTVQGNNMVIGCRMQVRVEKNRSSGREREAELFFYPDVGFDEVGSILHYLVKFKHWPGKRSPAGLVQEVTSPEFGYEGKPEGLIEKIEGENLEGKLRIIVQDVWNDVEEQCSVVRKRRYI